MNCDEAFDCLTDVQHRHDADLQKHLAGCPRCRAMQQTLAPAIGLLTGKTLAESSSLTAVREAPAARTAVAAGRRLARRSRRAAQAAATARQVKACVVATAAMAVIAFSALAINFSDRQQASGQVATKCLWKTRDLASDRHLTPAMITAACASCHAIVPSP